MENFSPWQNKICAIHLIFISQDFAKCLAFKYFYCRHVAAVTKTHHHTLSLLT